MRRLRGESGSVAVEAAVTLATIATIVVGGMAVSYYTFAKVWLERASYEALICLSTNAKASACESELRKISGSALPVGELTALRLTKTSRSARIELRYAVYGKDLFRIEDSRRLPLKSGGGR